MRPGGTAVIPLPPRGGHPENLLPTGTVALWPYTDMSDPQWRWGRRYVLFRHDTGRPNPQKAGLHTSENWTAYARGGRLFLKNFFSGYNGPFPDLGCNVEVFANPDFVEIETLAPMVTLEPGETTMHTEHWHLLDGVQTLRSEADVEKTIRRMSDSAADG
jgi:hypothetical protein